MSRNDTPPATPPPDGSYVTRPSCSTQCPEQYMPNIPPANNLPNWRSNNAENLQSEVAIIKHFENVLRKHEKNCTIKLEKIQAVKEVPLKKNLQKYTFSGTYTQKYIKHMLVKENPTKNEIKVYKEIFPLLETFKEGTNWPIPKFSFTNEMIIVNDLHDDGFSKANAESKTLNLQECCLVLMNLATFHATSLVLEHNNPLELQVMELPKVENVHHEFIAYLNNLDSSMSFNKCFDKTEVDALKFIIDKTKKDSKTLNKYSAICLGNLSKTNIMFGIHENQVRFLDYEQMHYGSIARDVICFLAVSLLPMVYLNSLYYFLDFYFRWLTHATKFNDIINVNFKFTSDGFKEEVNKVTPYGFLYAIWKIPEVFYANSDEELKSLRGILNDTADEKLHPGFVTRIKDMLKLFHSYFIKQLPQGNSSNNS